MEKAYSLICMYLLCASFVFSQVETRDAQWKKENDRGNRYEGLYQEEVGNPLFELIAFHGHFERYTFDQNQELKVSFCVPERQSTYRLHAEELRPKRYYWMEDKEISTVGGEHTFKKWPVDPWLSRRGIPASNLGVLVELDEAGSKKIAPAIVYHSQKPENLRYYVCYVRLGEDVAHGEYKVIPKDGEKAVNGGKIHTTYGGSHIRMIIPTSKLETSNWYKLELVVTPDGTRDSRRFKLEFYHQP